MHSKSLPTFVFGLSLGITGCGSSTPETSGSAGTAGSKVTTGGGGSTSSTAGSPAGGSLTGGGGSGGAASAGSPSGGTASGGTASGGTASGGMSSGGMSSGGKSSGGTSAGGSGGSSTGGSSGSGAGGSTGGKGAPVASKGCSVPNGLKTLTTGGMSVMKALPTSTRLKITSGGMSREYIIDIPADYDATRPYRLIFSWHQVGSSDTANAIGQYPAFDGPNFDAEHYAFFGLRREATTANQPAIFVAPQGIGGTPWDYNRDVVLFDDLLALLNANLCIDESRVFTTGFSFGAMMSYALSIGRASKLRAAVTMAAANFNFTQPTNTHTSIAYLGFTGMSDGRCPWVNNDARKEGGKYCVLQHAEDNGCTAATIPTTMAGSKKYVCYDFEGCKAGYPVKACTFDGAHTPSSIDDGMSSGDDGLKSFIPTLSWKFISQF